MTAIGQALSVALIDFVWQGFAVAMVLWMVLLVLRNGGAQARYVASCAALATLAAMPVITVWTVHARPIAIATGFPGAVSRAVSTEGAAVALGSGSVGFWVLRAWALGVLMFSLRLVWSSRHVYRLRRSGTQAESGVIAVVSSLANRMGVRRATRVLISSLADTPSVVGWLRPLILLPPACLMGLTAEQLETIIAHEVAHIRRHDYLVNVMQSVIETLLFYHPAVWWVSARIRHERELCCDDMVVATWGDPLGYARALTGLERLRNGQGVLALGSTDGPLSYRVRRLVGDVASERQGPSRLAGILVLCLGIVCLALPVSRGRLQAQEVPGADGQAISIQGARTTGRAQIVYRPDQLSDQVPETVSVEVALDAAGNVSDAHVLSGPAQLRKPVLASILGWQFAPEGAGATAIVTILFPTRSERARQQAMVRSFLGDQISEAKAARQAVRPRDVQDGPDKALFDKATQSIERGDYRGARLTLNALINTYDHSPLLPEAKLAIVDSWYREGGDWTLQQAAAEYSDFKKFYPDNPSR